MIVESNSQGVVPPQKYRVQGGHVALLGGKTAIYGNHPQPVLTVPVLTQQVEQARDSIPQSDIRHLSLIVYIKINLSENANVDVRCTFSEKLLFTEGWEKKVNHDVRMDLIKKIPIKMGREDVPQSTTRSIEAERRRGEGKNAGRKAGRPKAVNQGGEISPKNPE
ncbi:hypothetical protein TNCV_2949381 [Trichonephila clavipes]|nr:hypothetical protein TNCV_2949381 [Trichonephila clavipes]